MVTVRKFLLAYNLKSTNIESHDSGVTVQFINTSIIYVRNCICETTVTNTKTDDGNF
jgi:hypothetical protein